MEFYQGYSGGQAAVIGFVLVTNLKNRKKKQWLVQSREAVILIGLTPLWDCLEKSQKTDSGSSLTIYCCGVVIGFLLET
ncbi:hypothetical protein ACFX13_045637 [Malus domestica]